MIRVAVVVSVALVIATGADVLAGADHPGRVPVLSLAGTFALVLVAKGLGAAFIQRPVGSRPGDVDGAEVREGEGDA